MNLSEFKESIPSLLEKAKNTGEMMTEGTAKLIPSIGCLGDIDRVVVTLNSFFNRGLINDVVAWNASVSLGALLGEAIIREHGFHWAMTEDGMAVVETEDGNQISPITKIYKIITADNECEGSPSSFYNALLALMQLDAISAEEREISDKTQTNELNFIEMPGKIVEP